MVSVLAFGWSGWLAGVVGLALFVVWLVGLLLSQSKSLLVLSGFWLSSRKLLRVAAVCRRTLAGLSLLGFSVVGSSGACCARSALLGWGGRFPGLFVAARLVAATARQFWQGMGRLVVTKPDQPLAKLKHGSVPSLSTKKMQRKTPPLSP